MMFERARERGPLKLTAVAGLVLALLACQKPSPPSVEPEETTPMAVTAAATAAATAAETAVLARAAAPETAPASTARVRALEAEPAGSSWSIKVSGRVVAIGDLHGDLAAALQALELAGAIDRRGAWVGGDLTVVQTGDQLDRGDDERKILDLFLRLEGEARAAGGQLIVLNGNHEVMNVAGDFRYVTPGGFAEFEGVEAGQGATLPEMVPPFARARAAAFWPGGPYAQQLASRRVIAKVGDDLFAHGGVREAHLDYGIERVNRETAQWMNGRGPAPDVLQSEQGPIWTRIYSEPQPQPQACQELSRVLKRTETKRLIVGHTVQRDGITSACDGRVYRIDVGLASYYGGERIQVLELAPGAPRILSEARSLAQAAE